MADDSVRRLADVMRAGLDATKEELHGAVEGIFGGSNRYHSKNLEKTSARYAYALASDETGGVPYAGFINPDNPPSGAYGGTSIVWFPIKSDDSAAKALITFVVGTRGLSPDEGILTRPGHRRRIGALRRYLARLGVEAWTKPDPAALGVGVPDEVQRRFGGFENAFKRYGHEMYCIAAVPTDAAKARDVVQAFLDIYAHERGWQVLAGAANEYAGFHGKLRADIFETVDAARVNTLLRHRRFVVLQGPPGTGKTRMAEEIRKQHFDGHGKTVQFHPAVTYEDFIVGLSPNPVESGLKFDVRPGWLLQAAKAAASSPFVLIIDEVNRADLGKVLGEAIYLFEPGEVGGPNARSVDLPHPFNGSRSFVLPENLYVLATMNTADRSIAGMDLAVRRRFAFVTLMPDRKVVEDQAASPEAVALAVAMFDRLSDVFVEHAPEDALDLLPGHSYFLAKDETELRQRFRFELLPLLDEYLRQGFLGPATTELHAVRDAVDAAVLGNGTEQ